MPQHFDIPCHTHYLTFSCYRGYWLFRPEPICRIFIETLSEQRANLKFKLYAYVIIPNHVHLLLEPTSETTIESILKPLKRISSARAHRWLSANDSVCCQKLYVKKGKVDIWRFWQQGGGYDRNIISNAEFKQKIGYIHNNPVRKGLVKDPLDWKWSSAKFWIRNEDDPLRMDIPKIL